MRRSWKHPKRSREHPCTMSRVVVASTSFRTRWFQRGWPSSEIFDDEAAVYAHPRFEHYPKWRAATADGSLAQGQWERVIVRKCISVFPDDNANYDSVIAGVDENAPFERRCLHKPRRIPGESRARGRLHRRKPGSRRSARYTRYRAVCVSTFTRPMTSRLCCGSTRCTRTRRRSNAAQMQPSAKQWAETVKDWYSGEVPPSYRGPNISPALPPATVLGVELREAPVVVGNRLGGRSQAGARYTVRGRSERNLPIRRAMTRQ